MTTITRTIRTDKNVWTFDVSVPIGGTPKVLRTYGNVTNKAALDEAVELLTIEVADHYEKRT